MGKFFTVEVKPTIPNVAIGQHTAYSNGDILFDWFAFDIPKGACKLIGISVELRPKGNGNADPNLFALELMVTKTKTGVAPITLGAVNSPPTSVLNPGRMIAYVPVKGSHFAAELDSISFAQTAAPVTVVFDGEPSTGVNVGYDKYYIAGIAGDSIDFTSLTRINNGDLDGPTMTTSGTDPRLFLDVGDTVAVTTAADTAVTKAMGEIASMTATTIVLTEAFTTADVVHTDFVYNVSPMTIKLHFER